MTVKEFIAKKYQSFGGVAPEHEIESVVLAGELDPDANLTRETLLIAERAFVQRIPEMLLQPTSVSELGVSISRAGQDALRIYYRAKCRELGLENLLDASERPRVTIY